MTLVIDLVGTYIDNEMNQRQASQQYLADYIRYWDDLLQSKYIRDLSISNKMIWIIWNMILEKIERYHTDSQPDLLFIFLVRFSDEMIQDKLFRLISLSISSIIQKLYDENTELSEWFIKTLISDRKKRNNFYYRQDCNVLIRYNLLQRIQGDWDNIRIHKLIQWQMTKFEQMIL